MKRQESREKHLRQRLVLRITLAQSARSFFITKVTAEQSTWLESEKSRRETARGNPKQFGGALCWSDWAADNAVIWRCFKGNVSPRQAGWSYYLILCLLFALNTTLYTKSHNSNKNPISEGLKCIFLIFERSAPSIAGWRNRWNQRSRICLWLKCKSEVGQCLWAVRVKFSTTKFIFVDSIIQHFRLLIEDINLTCFQLDGIVSLAKTSCQVLFSASTWY